MKNTKKIILCLFMVLFSLTLVACKSENVEGSLEEIMTKVYKNLPEEDTPMALQNIEITNDNIEYFIGTKDIEYEEALASESQTGSIAHSVVLIRVKDTKDIEKTKDKIKNSVDPRKWICVGVERDQVIVENKGNLIILIINEENSDKIKQGFDNL